MTMTCYVYDDRYCKVLIIACCDMQFEDNTTKYSFGRKKIEYYHGEQWSAKGKVQLVLG